MRVHEKKRYVCTSRIQHCKYYCLCVYPAGTDELNEANGQQHIYVALFILALCFFCLLCVYGHTYSKSMDQPGKVASPAHGQLNR